jgi:hypothetical protein
MCRGREERNRRWRALFTILLAFGFGLLGSLLEPWLGIGSVVGDNGRAHGSWLRVGSDVGDGRVARGSCNILALLKMNYAREGEELRLTRCLRIRLGLLLVLALGIQPWSASSSILCS